MLDIILGTIAAGGSFIGGERANAASAHQASMNRQFQQDMSGTAHQRESADLRAAGLNRILGISKGGSGASTPSGSMATQQDTVTPAINTALSARRTSAEVANMEEANTAIKENVLKTKAEVRLIDAQKNVVDANTPYRETMGEIWDVARSSAKGIKSFFGHHLDRSKTAFSKLFEGKSSAQQKQIQETERQLNIKRREETRQKIDNKIKSFNENYQKFSNKRLGDYFKK